MSKKIIITASLINIHTVHHVNKREKMLIVVPPNTKGHFHVVLFSSGRSESNGMVKK